MSTRASRMRQAHLEAFVSRLRTCLSALGSEQQHLLSLRAGLNGAPQTAPTVARILHIGTAREALLERVSLVALRSAAGSGCAGNGSASSPTITSVTTGAGAGGRLVPSVSYLPPSSRSAVTRPGRTGQSSGSGRSATSSAGSSRGGSGTSHGTHGTPPTLAANGLQRASATTSQSPALAIAVLMLLASTVILMKPWRRRSPVTVGSPGAPGAPGSGMVAATATPVRPSVRPSADRGTAASRWAPPAAQPAPKSTAAPARAPVSAPAPAPLSSQPAPAAPAPAPVSSQPAPAAPAPAPVSSQPGPAAPAPTSAPSRSAPALPARSREPGWLRDHAAQGALVATAVAGMLARGLTRRSGPGRRR